MTSVVTILTVGDELMIGDRVDTNGPWLSRALLEHGLTTVERCSVRDNVPCIAQAIKRLASHSDLLIITGGLGPTEDDRTREALTSAMHEQLVIDQDAHDSIRKWFTHRGAEMPAANDVQALLPVSASWIPNAHGTAPGIRATLEACQILCLPGPPPELQPMYKLVIDEVLSGLQCGTAVTTTQVHAWGLSEAVAGSMIADLMQAEDPTVALLIGVKGVTARVTSADQKTIEKIATEIEQRWSPWNYGRNDQTLAGCVGACLERRDETLATAESCTGGFIGELIVDQVGASAWYQGGWVTYSNPMKVEQLGVLQTMLDDHGAVSCDVAAAMCVGAVRKSGAMCAISTTGIAGPSGGSETKPVGTVFIGCMVDGTVEVRLFRFSGDREAIRRRAASTALQMLHFRLTKNAYPAMCWQHGEVMSC